MSAYISSCSEDWDMQLQNFNFACAASFAFTVIATSFYSCCLKSHLGGAPQLAAQFFFLIGILKLGFVITIVVLVIPECPDACVCQSQPLWRIYPFIALLVALKWLLRATQFYSLSRRISSENEDKDGPIFDRVSTVEMA